MASTQRLQAFVEDLRGMMTVTDLAAVTGLGWNTVRNIIEARLEKDYGHPRLKELRRVSIVLQSVLRLDSYTRARF